MRQFKHISLIFICSLLFIACSQKEVKVLEEIEETPSLHSKIIAVQAK